MRLVPGENIRAWFTGAVVLWLPLCLSCACRTASAGWFLGGVDPCIAVGASAGSACLAIGGIVPGDAQAGHGCTHCPRGGRCADFPAKGLMVRPRTGADATLPTVVLTCPDPLAAQDLASGSRWCRVEPPPASSYGIHSTLAKLALHATVVLRL